MLRTVVDWSLFFRRLFGMSAASSGSRDPDLDKLVSVVMAYRLSDPLECLGNESVVIPVLDCRSLTLAQKLKWLFKFNRSDREFTINTWKDCRKQTRKSRMLPESMYLDLLAEMLAWTPGDGSPLDDDPDGWDAVNQIDFTDAIAVSDVISDVIACSGVVACVS